jgi:hypothetical protein
VRNGRIRGSMAPSGMMRWAEIADKGQMFGKMFLLKCRKLSTKAF